MYTGGRENMLEKYQLTDMGKWANFVGIVFIVTGILNCISLVGIIPGIIFIFLGLKLRGVKRYSEEAAASSDEASQAGSLNMMVSELSSFFKIQGIFIIIALVLTVLAILFFVAVLLPLFMSAINNPYYFY